MIYLDKNPALSIRIPAVEEEGKRWSSEHARKFLHRPKLTTISLRRICAGRRSGMRKAKCLAYADAADFEQRRLSRNINYNVSVASWSIVRPRPRNRTARCHSRLSSGLHSNFGLLTGTRISKTLPRPWHDFNLMSVPGTAHRVIHVLQPIMGCAIAKQEYRRSPCTTADAPADHCWPTSDVHPRSHGDPRHAQFAITMEIYTEVSDEARVLA